MIVKAQEIIELNATCIEGGYRGLTFNLKLLPGDSIHLVEVSKVRDRPDQEYAADCIFEVDTGRLDGLQSDDQMARIKIDMYECIAKIPDFERDLTEAMIRTEKERKAIEAKEINETTTNPLHGAW